MSGRHFQYHIEFLLCNDHEIYTFHAASDNSLCYEPSTLMKDEGAQHSGLTSAFYRSHSSFLMEITIRAPALLF